MALQPVAFQPPKREVGKKGKEGSGAKLAAGLGIAGAIAGGVIGTMAAPGVGTAAGAKTGALLGGALAGAGSGQALGSTLGGLIGERVDPSRADTRRIEVPQVQQLDPLSSFPEVKASTRSRMIADALTALQTQPDELKAAYTEPLTIGFIGSIAVDKETQGGLA